MPPPIIDERFLQRIRANYGELGAPAFVYGGGGLGPGEQGPEVPGYDAVSRKVMLDRLRGRPGALNRLQQQMGPQGGMQGPEP